MNHFEIPWNGIEAYVDSLPAVDGPDAWHDPVGNAERSALSAAIGSALLTIGDRQAGIVSLRAGLTDGQPWTLKQAGERYYASARTAGSIENKALTRLRRPACAKKLEAFAGHDTDNADIPSSRPITSVRPNIFSDIAVPVLDDADPRPYPARLREACGIWREDIYRSLDKKSATNAILYTAHRTKPDCMLLDGVPIATGSDARLHYRALANRLTRAITRLDWQPQSTVHALLKDGTITLRDLHDIRGTHVVPKTVAYRKIMQESAFDLRRTAVERRGFCVGRQNAIKDNEIALWAPSATAQRCYKRERFVQALGFHTEYPEFQQLTATRRRILQRPATAGTTAANQASLLVIDTKLAALRTRLAHNTRAVAQYARGKDGAYIVI